MNADNLWVSLRHEFHQQPELSHQEHLTADKVAEVLQSYSPAQILRNVGDHGVIAVFDSHQEGPTTLIRAELDALPIHESMDIAHISQCCSVSHKCGHDGHMAIVLSLAEQLQSKPIARGKVLLAFQSAEETGKGAQLMVSNEQFLPLTPDYAFALHNYPGMPLGHVGIKAGPFNCASTGIIITLKGATSHAAYPEHGNNPGLAMCHIIEHALALPQLTSVQSWVTLIYSKLGEIAFGTSAGDAVIMFTLRSETNVGIKQLESSLIEFTKQKANDYNLEVSVDYEDAFAATINDETAASMIEVTAKANRIPVEILDEPMRWSEDFGRFTQVAKHGAMFVLGSGEQHPQLHHPDYDFPDSLIATGQCLFTGLIREING